MLRLEKFWRPLIAILLLMPCLAFSQEEAAIQVKIGNTVVKLIVGDITQQKTDGLVISHWPNTVNDGGGVGGALADAAGNEIFSDFRQIMKGQRTLPYTSVYPTAVAPGSPLYIKTLFNVIELKPKSRLEFLSVDELDHSTVPMDPQDIKTYRTLIEKYGAAGRAHEAALNAQWARGASAGGPELAKYMALLYQGSGTPFEEERSALIEKYLKPIGFRTVVETTQNVLARAATMENMKSLSFPTLGYGRMGDLDADESISAILTGIQVYSEQEGVNAPNEIRIVLYPTSSKVTPKWAANYLQTIFAKGGFLAEAQKFLPGWNDQNWTLSHNTYMEKSQPSLQVLGRSQSKKDCLFCLKNLI